MSNKKFIIEKETEYKNGKIETWYFIKLMTDGHAQLIDLCKDDEARANEIFESAIKLYVPSSKTIIRELIVEEVENEN